MCPLEVKEFRLRLFRFFPQLVLGDTLWRLHNVARISLRRDMNVLFSQGRPRAILKRFFKFSFHNICELMHQQMISQKTFPKGVTAWSALEKPKMFKLNRPMRFFHMTMDWSFHITSTILKLWWPQAAFLTDCRVALVAIHPSVLIILGGVLVRLFFFHDVTHVLPRFATRLQREYCLSLQWNSKRRTATSAITINSVIKRPVLTWQICKQVTNNSIKVFLSICRKQRKLNLSRNSQKNGSKSKIRQQGDFWRNLVKGQTVLITVKHRLSSMDISLSKQTQQTDECNEPKLAMRKRDIC